MAEYIKRDDALKIMKDAWMLHPSGDDAIQEAIDCISLLPTADVVERKIGKWEEVEVTWLADIEEQPDAIASMFCPECKRFANHVYHYGSPTHGMNFCPNCGADMREETDGT